jgi:hypothetical protein
MKQCRQVEKIRSKLLRGCRDLIELNMQPLTNRAFLKQQLGLILENLEELLQSLDYDTKESIGGE